MLGAVVFAGAVGKRTVIMPGPMAAKHASFANECVRCHAPPASFQMQVPDASCKSCHQTPIHFGDHALAATMNCTSCHLVHKGNAMSVNATGKDCLQCHADLKVKNASFAITPSITDFATHPEFSVTVKDDAGRPRRVRLNDPEHLKDGTMIKLNHKLHLDPELPG